MFQQTTISFYIPTACIDGGITQMQFLKAKLLNKTDEKQTREKYYILYLEETRMLR